MGSPVMLVENRLSVRQFPGHTLTISSPTSGSEPAGFEVDRLANDRRSALDYATWSDANVIVDVTIDCEAAVSVDCLFLDRGHNLAGETVEFRRSTDNFSTDNTLVFSAVIPSTAATSGDLDASNGITTDELAWVKRFTSISFRYYRIRVLAMGAGLTPKHVGIKLGELYNPPPFTRPVHDDVVELVGQRHENRIGWSADTELGQRRVGEIRLRLRNDTQIADAERHIRDNFLRGRTAVLIHDDDVTERAAVVKANLGRSGLQWPTDWGRKAAVIPWTEYEAKRI